MKKGDRVKITEPNVFDIPVGRIGRVIDEDFIYGDEIVKIQFEQHVEWLSTGNEWLEKLDKFKIGDKVKHDFRGFGVIKDIDGGSLKYLVELENESIRPWCSEDSLKTVEDSTPEKKDKNMKIVEEKSFSVNGNKFETRDKAENFFILEKIATLLSGKFHNSEKHNIIKNKTVLLQILKEAME